MTVDSGGEWWCYIGGSSVTCYRGPIYGSSCSRTASDCPPPPCRVLKPPGGGSSNIFGPADDEPAPVRVNNRGASSLVLGEEPAPSAPAPAPAADEPGKGAMMKRRYPSLSGILGRHAGVSSSWGEMLNCSSCGKLRVATLCDVTCKTAAVAQLG